MTLSLRFTRKKESIVDTKEELKNAITSSGEFYYPEKVIADCMIALDIIPVFLDYYNTFK